MSLMFFLRPLVPLILLFSLILGPTGALAQQGEGEEDPRLILQGIIDEISAVWVPLNLDPNAPYDSRRAWAEDLVNWRFDFPHMSRNSLGPNWRQLNEAQQEQYRVLFRQILVETVIDWLDDYDSEVIEILRVRPAGRNVEITTRIVYPDGSRIGATWVVRETEGMFLFRDVRVAGISLVADFRGKYVRFMNRDGIEGLFDRLERDIRRLQRRHS